MSDSILGKVPADSSVGRPTEQAHPARARRGPETVVNPERRAQPVATAVAPTAAERSAKSNVGSVLFPPDDSAPGPSGAVNGIEIGHFTIFERIRSGGMGAVFRALDTRLNRTVALKILPPALSRDPSIVQRFRNEAQ